MTDNSIMATSTPFSNSDPPSDIFRQSEMNLKNMTDMIRARDVALSLQGSSVTPQTKRAFEIRQKSWYVSVYIGHGWRSMKKNIATC